MNALMKRIAIPTLALGAAVLMFSCETAESTSQPTTMSSAVSMGMVNSTCPMTSNPVDGSTTTSWRGKTIGFCCGGCVGAWNKWSDEKKAAYVAQAGN